MRSASRDMQFPRHSSGYCPTSETVNYQVRSARPAGITLQENQSPASCPAEISWVGISDVNN